MLTTLLHTLNGADLLAFALGVLSAVVIADDIARRAWGH